jgi:hypothetical protein
LLLPFSANLIALWLSSYTVAGPTLYPWCSKNCLVQMICPVESDNATSSDSADDVVFNRCIPDFAYTGPFPKVITAPVWLFRSQCTPYAASIKAVTDKLTSPLSLIPNLL